MNIELTSAGLFRRLAALFYDALVVLALEIIASGTVIAVMFALHTLHLLHYSPYLDAADMLDHHPILHPLFTLYLGMVWGYFFVFFWTRSGQTLGMRAWKIQVCNHHDGQKVSRKQAITRLVLSCFGMTNLSVLFNAQKLALHDKLSKTRVIVIQQ